MKIKGKDLQVGDIFSLHENRLVVYKMDRGLISTWNETSRRLEIWSGDDVWVEVLSRAHPALTPAQQHADEIWRLLKWAAEHMGSSLDTTEWFADFDSMRAEIEPKPPTLEEAVELLKAVAVSGAHPDIAAFLERAKCN